MVVVAEAAVVAVAVAVAGTKNATAAEEEEVVVDAEEVTMKEEGGTTIVEIVLIRGEAATMMEGDTTTAVIQEEAATTTVVVVVVVTTIDETVIARTVLIVVPGAAVASERTTGIGGATMTGVTDVMTDASTTTEDLHAAQATGSLLLVSAITLATAKRKPTTVFRLMPLREQTPASKKKPPRPPLCQSKMSPYLLSFSRFGLGGTEVTRKHKKCMLMQCRNAFSFRISSTVLVNIWL